MRSFFLITVFSVCLLFVSRLALPTITYAGMDSRQGGLPTHQDLQNPRLQGQVENFRRGIQILYTMGMVELSTIDANKLGLTELQFKQETEHGGLLLITHPELLEYAGSSVAIALTSQRDTGYTATLTGPQIVVSLGKTGRLYVAQEEISLNEAQAARSTTAFELVITPLRASHDNDGSILTHIRMNAGSRTTGLETEAQIGADRPYLLGMVQSSQVGSGQGRLSKEHVDTRRYFALYLTAHPVEVLPLEGLGTAGSLLGLEGLFSAAKVPSETGYIRIALRKDIHTGVSLSGLLRSKGGVKLDVGLHEILTGNHRLAVLLHMYQRLFLGGEIIYCSQDELLLAISLMDTVEFKQFTLQAGLYPLVYSPNKGQQKMRWYIHGEARPYKDLHLELGYRSQGATSFAEMSVGYWFSESFLASLGYKHDARDRGMYWLGIRLEM